MITYLYIDAVIKREREFDMLFFLALFVDASLLVGGFFLVKILWSVLFG